MKEPRSLRQLNENLQQKVKIGDEKIANVQKQRLATDMDKFFGHGNSKQSTLINDDQLNKQKVLFQKNIDERSQIKEMIQGFPAIAKETQVVFDDSINQEQETYDQQLYEQSIVLDQYIRNSISRPRDKVDFDEDCIQQLRTHSPDQIRKNVQKIVKDLQGHPNKQSEATLNSNKRQNYVSSKVMQAFEDIQDVKNQVITQRSMARLQQKLVYS